MIDTIVLILSPDKYHISEPPKFTPSAAWIFKDNFKNYSSIKSKQNNSKKDLLSGIYKPQLTLSYHRGIDGFYEILLRIELSLPKLLYGNNFNELQYKDFNEIIDKLVITLKSMGVIVGKNNLSEAQVLSIHYSKNIPLIDGSTPYHYINKIREANVKLSLDINQTDYRNEGHSYKWHANSYEVIFYDKIKDLEKSKQSSKRSLEIDSELQFDLIKHFSSRHKLEFLRMEVRLNKRSKIKHLFKTLNIQAELTFKKLFKPAISKKILLYYFDELENNRSPLLKFKINDDKAFINLLAFNNPKITPKQVMTILGFKRALEVANLRELKSILGKFNPQSWYRLIKESSAIKLPIADNSFRCIKDCLLKFKAIKLNY